MRLRCPTCKGPSSLARDNLHRPFCSERCRLIDLNGWLDERFVIPGEPASSDSSLDRTLDGLRDDDMS